jgi:hypothetical protein
MHRDFFDAALKGGDGGGKVTHARIVSRLAGRRQLMGDVKPTCDRRALPLASLVRDASPL